jgi:O-antigen/teichoic acid export membrane protein
VPAIVISAISSLLLSWYFASKLSLKKVKITFDDLKLEGKEMLIMGFMISLSGIITLIFSYLVRIFISNYGSVEDVGLYNAGFAIVNSYVGMIFTAMATDYYPKLSAIANDNIKANETINQQAEIAILILSPIILIFIFFIKWIIVLLYSNAFIAIDDMILYAASGMVFKALSWAIAFLFLARGASRLFFWNEFISNIYMFGLNLLGYYWLGLKGLGISFLISYILYGLQVIWVSKHYFKFEITFELKKIVLVNVLIIMICLVTVFTFDSVIAKSIGILVLTFSICFNIFHLDKKLGLKAMYFNLTSKKKINES